MSAGEARHGRRDNGLVAAEYAPAGDVDPRVGEHLLDVLALDGIAAYLRPSADMHPVTRSSSLPGRPTDRLYVDRAHLATARDYLARLDNDTDDNTDRDSGNGGGDHAGGGSASDPDRASTAALAERDGVDQAWAEIIAGYDADVETPSRPWPDAEEIADIDLDRWAGEPSQPSARSGRVAADRAEPDEPSLLDGLDTFGADLPGDASDEEGYTPPAPPPVPRPSLPTALAIAGIFCGLIVFLRPDLMPMAESTAMLAGFAAIIAGFATLVWRLRPGDVDDEDSDPDHGARV